MWFDVEQVIFETSTDRDVKCKRFVHALTLTSVLGRGFSYDFTAIGPAVCRRGRVAGIYSYVSLSVSSRFGAFVRLLAKRRVIILSGCFFSARCRHRVGRGKYLLIYVSSTRGGRCITSIMVGRNLRSVLLFSIRPCAGLYLKFG